MRGGAKLFAAALVSALIIAACGDDDDTSTGATSATTAASSAATTGGGSATTAGGSATTAAGGSATTAAGGAGTLKLDKPVKIVMLAEIQGESAIAVSDFDNGAKLAIDAINAAGGIGGQQVQYERVPASPLDQAQTNQAYLKALDANPTILMGFPGGGTQVGFSLANINKGKIPFLITALGDDNVRFGAAQGSEFVWFLNSYTNGIASAGVQYLHEELKANKIALAGTNEGYGSASIAGSKDYMGKNGLSPQSEQTYSPTATDLVSQVLAIKGADAVANWGYPNPLGVYLTQMKQNGIDIPTMGGESPGIVSSFKLAPDDAIGKLYSAALCNPTATDNAALKKFTSDYQAKFGAVPLDLAAFTYDGVYVVKAAVEAAGSTDPAKLNAALATVDVKGGLICQPELKADGSHFFPHSVTIVKMGPGGAGTVQKTYTLPNLPKAG
jgi:branched-chain amino acid transport system substrate-binding protein